MDASSWLSVVVVLLIVLTLVWFTNVSDSDSDSEAEGLVDFSPGLGLLLYEGAVVAVAAGSCGSV
jgi:hypothetical protein